MNPIRGCDLDSRTPGSATQTSRTPPKSARTPTRWPFRLSRRHAQMLETLVSVGCPMTPLAAAVVIGLGTMI
jgi:hypothetical protein